MIHMSRFVTFAVLLAMAALVPSSALAAGEAGATQHNTGQFAKGKSSAQVRGSIKGGGDAEYTINARAGQTLAVSSKSSNGSLNFNISPAGAQEAMFIGGTQGVKASVMLLADGAYVMMREAACQDTMDTSN